MDVEYYCENPEEILAAAKDNEELTVQVTDVIVGHSSALIKFRFVEVA